MMPERDPDPLVQRLRAMVKDAPELEGAAGIYEVMLPLLRDADLNIPPLSITPDQAKEMAAKGLPLLTDIELEFDPAAIGGLMFRVASALEGVRGQSRPYGEIRLALENNKLDRAALFTGILEGEREAVFSMAERLNLDPELLWTLAQNALKPLFGAWRRQLTPLLRGLPWPKGTCPICGAPAILGELRGNHQAKHLRCGQCGADWRFGRLECLSCGNVDHRTLGYLYGESQQEKMRVEVCDKCQGYLKVISAFTPTLPEMLAIEDLATLHLDYCAQARGYRPAARAEV